MGVEYTTVDGARVGVLMGSASDWPTMKACSETLGQLAIEHECNGRRIGSGTTAPRRRSAGSRCSSRPPAARPTSPVWRPR